MTEEVKEQLVISFDDSELQAALVKILRRTKGIKSVILQFPARMANEETNRE
jgi:hypothetical protein